MESTLKGIAGLNNAGRSQQWLRRFIWMVIFLVGLAGTLHSTYVVVEDMLSYPVDTTVTITTEEYVRPRLDHLLHIYSNLFLFFRSIFRQ